MYYSYHAPRSSRTPDALCQADLSACEAAAHTGPVGSRPPLRVSALHPLPHQYPHPLQALPVTALERLWGCLGTCAWKGLREGMRYLQQVIRACHLLSDSCECYIEHSGGKGARTQDTESVRAGQHRKQIPDAVSMTSVPLKVSGWSEGRWERKGVNQVCMLW